MKHFWEGVTKAEVATLIAHHKQTQPKPTRPDKVRGCRFWAGCDTRTGKPVHEACRIFWHHRALKPIGGVDESYIGPFRTATEALDAIGRKWGTTASENAADAYYGKGE